LSAIVLDPDRFEIGKPKRKRRYTQQTHQMQPPQGPSSASPGPWLPETIVDAWMQEKKDPEKFPEYKNAVTIRDSYRQYVFGPVVSPPVDNNPPFSMVEQPNVLAGERWLKSELRLRSLYKLTQHAQEMVWDEDTEHEGSLYSLNDDGEVEDADDHEERVEVDFSEVDEENEVQEVKSSPSPSPVSVSDETMDAVYRKWFSEPEPSHSTKQALWETGHNFLCKKSSLARKGDDLRTQGLSNDFQMEFEVRLMRILNWMKARKKEKVINQPSHYLTRMWNNSRKTALKELTKENRKHPSILELRNDDPLDEDAPNHMDLAESQRWQNGNNSDVNSIEDQEAAKAETLRRREAKLAAMPPDLQDVIGMRIAGLKQQQMGARLNISQQAVSKKLIKATSSLQEVN
jgi:DNA-directed RNA polymerase specialized sigma24 family protein